MKDKIIYNNKNKNKQKYINKIQINYKKGLNNVI